MTTPTPAPTVVVVDDHPVFRHGLAALLAEDDITVLAQAGTIAQALAAVTAHRPDIVVMDLHLPDGSGVTATRQILADHPDTRVLVLTMDSADASTLAALRAGARGYLLKETAARTISTTIHALMRGELVLDSALAPRLPSLLGPAHHSDHPELDGFTPREQQVLNLVGQGMANAEIGRHLFLAEKTIRNHITVLLAKTGLTTRPALIAHIRNTPTANTE